ncbi:acyltransferase family protein [Micropruina sp.]|uniref:acyltransferase family protein n=1 Tax=Micropruina sp. TaxID=2737536 RepID=UPI0039E276A0
MTQRNHLIDLARALSVLVVVTFHCLLYQVVVVDGRPQVVPWAPQPHAAWWTASWLVMIIPLFFIAGGFAHALVVDKQRAQGRGYTYYLASRAHRLVGPLLIFVGFCTALTTAAAWLGPTGPAVALSVQFAQLLWFIAVYLVIVGVAPFMVTLHDRTPWLPVVVLGVLAIAVDVWSFAAGDFQVRYANLLTVWPLCHQFGIAYHRGWFRTGAAWVPSLVIGLAATTIAVLIFGFGYPGSSIGLGDIPIANVLPPTVAMAVLGAAQVSVLGLLQRAGVAATLSRRNERALALANALAVTTYLWHIPCIVIAGGLLVGLSLLVPPAVGVLLAQPTMVIVTYAVIALVVPRIGRLEYALIPRLGETPARGVLPAYLLLMLGTALVWHYGTVLHPAQPASAAGLALLAGGMAWLARAASAPPRID